jgi:Ser/Thr protein kinase RdoA (MazF antagonist)
MINFQKRINYQGSLKPFLQQTCKDFNIGKYKNYEIIPIGYEDFNLLVFTDRDKYFVKIFGSFRSKDECSRYVEIMESILRVGVSHPLLFQSNQGYLYELSNDNQTDRLCVMEYIDGKIFYELQTTPTKEEKCFIIKQVALINKIDIKPFLVYDHWATTNFLKEYNKKGKYLNKDDKKLVEPMIEVYNSLSIDNLPHCFVHGDIIKTNVMRSKKNKIYILDFAVANCYPRIQELAVILCDLFFDPKNPSEFSQNYNLTISEYQKYIPLTHDELKKLPNCVKLAHAMHILLANYEKIVKGNQFSENEYFLEIGKAGLKYTN